MISNWVININLNDLGDDLWCIFSPSPFFSPNLFVLSIFICPIAIA